MSAGEPVASFPPSASAEPRSIIVNRFQRAGSLSIALTAAVALLALLGWTIGVPLVVGAPSGPPAMMTANTALILVTTSAAMWLYARTGPSIEPPRTLLACVGGGTLLSLVPLVERATGWQFGVDEVLAATTSGLPRSPVAEPIEIIIGALLLQGALLCAVRPTRYGPAQMLAIGTMLVSVFAAIREPFSQTLESTVTGYGVMAGPAAAGLLLLSFGLLLSDPERGLTRTAVDTGPGGVALRHVLPAVAAVPIVIGLLVWIGVHGARYSPASGLALTITLTIAALGATAFWVATRLRRIEHERQDADMRRHDAESRWRRAVMDSPTPMVVHDGDQIVDMNRAWADIAAIDASTAPTITAWIAQTQPDRVAALPAFRARLAAATATVYDGELTIRTPAGDDRVWELSSTPIGIVGDDRRFFVSTAIDITARRQSEATLQHLNDELEQRIAERTTALTRANDALKRQSEQVREQSLLLDLVRDGILVRDLYGTIVYWNRGASAMYGWAKEQALGKVSHQLLGAEYPMPLAEIEKQVMRTGLWEGDVVHITQDGSRLLVESRWTLTRTERGAPEGFLEVHRDMSQRRQAERALEAKAEALARSNRELEQFAYVASHDLQEPLRMVSNYTQLLAKRYRDRLDTDANEFIDFAVDGAKRMQDLIHDLLQYARVERAGREFKPVHAERIVTDALANLAGAIDESAASIMVDPLPTLTCDASQMTQVFQNLIGNALKFRKPDRAPVVRVTASRDDAAWRLAVSDNGIGIENRFFERIFQMFQRLHGRGEYSGTGIGLALCKKIVERHGGRIWVESEYGRGTTFFLTVPDAAAPTA